MLHERGFDIVQQATHGAVPARLLGLGPALSGLAPRLPVLRGLGVIQLIVARKRTDASHSGRTD